MEREVDLELGVEGLGASIRTRDSHASNNATTCGCPRAAQDAERATDLPWRDAVAGEVDAAAHLIATGECQQGITAVLGRTTPRFGDPE